MAQGVRYWAHDLLEQIKPLIFSGFSMPLSRLLADLFPEAMLSHRNALERMSTTEGGHLNGRADD